MNLPMPFAYSTVPHARRHSPRGYKNYGDYKPFLRDDYSFRCAYCLERETWYPNGADAFAAEHVEPKSANPDRLRDYENLVYACGRCNSRKSAVLDFLDPTRVPLAVHLRLCEDGQIEGLTPEGRKLIALLHLNIAPALHVRRENLHVLAIKRELPDSPAVHAIFLARFAFPSDLPDLTRYRPPGGNDRPEGISESHHARRLRGELPETY